MAPRPALSSQLYAAENQPGQNNNNDNPNPKFRCLARRCGKLVARNKRTPHARTHYHEDRPYEDERLNEVLRRMMEREGVAPRPGNPQRGANPVEIAQEQDMAPIQAEDHDDEAAPRPGINMPVAQAGIPPFNFEELAERVEEVIFEVRGINNRLDQLGIPRNNIAPPQNARIEGDGGVGALPGVHEPEAPEANLEMINENAAALIGDEFPAAEDLFDHREIWEIAVAYPADLGPEDGQDDNAEILEEQGAYAVAEPPLVDEENEDNADQSTLVMTDESDEEGPLNVAEDPYIRRRFRE